MSRSKRLMLLSGASVAVAASLSLGSVAAQDDDSMDDMASLAPTESMEPTGSMEPMAPGLYVRDAWTRESPMVDLAGAAYLVIHNNTDADDALIGASSPVAEVVEIHQSSMDDEGVMSMAQVEEIPIPAYEDAILEPGGYHIMLINLVEPLVEGTDVEITLDFLTAESQTVTAVVGSGPVMDDLGMSMDDEMGDDAGGAMGDGDDMDDEGAESDG